MLYSILAEKIEIRYQKCTVFCMSVGASQSEVVIIITPVLRVGNKMPILNIIYIPRLFHRLWQRIKVFFDFNQRIFDIVIDAIEPEIMLLRP